jgi:hypothetical protein
MSNSRVEDKAGVLFIIPNVNRVDVVVPEE